MINAQQRGSIFTRLMAAIWVPKTAFRSVFSIDVLSRPCSSIARAKTSRVLRVSRIVDRNHYARPPEPLTDPGQG